MKEMIGTPIGGWKADTWYLVEVAYSESNVIHRALFYSGFLNDGIPGNYNFFAQGSYGEMNSTIKDAYYLKIIKKVLNSRDFKIKNCTTPDMLKEERNKKNA